MRFKITWASDWHNRPIYKEFETLQDLKEFCEEENDSLVIDFRDMTIIVYDYYIE